MRTAVIFGGNGFIGQHFSQHLLANDVVDKVILADLAEQEEKCSLTEYVNTGLLTRERVDVRQKISLNVANVSLICNFAAVHREPGHEAEEYFETNILGAENVCQWASEVGCNTILFTSSIAPYGTAELPKKESSLPIPITPYGSSKLVAEKSHAIWQAQDKDNRKLIIVRPGVIFGPGEGGNVSRMVKAVKHRYFVYLGNKNTVKAGIYIKELCSIMQWAISNNTNEVSLFNATMTPAPTIGQYVDVICETAGFKRFIPNIPFFLMLPPPKRSNTFASFGISFFIFCISPFPKIILVGL